MSPMRNEPCVLYVYIYIYIYVFIYTHTYTSLSLSIYIYTHILYIYVYIYTYSHTSRDFLVLSTGYGLGCSAEIIHIYIYIYIYNLPPPLIRTPPSYNLTSLGGHLIYGSSWERTVFHEILQGSFCFPLARVYSGGLREFKGECNLFPVEVRCCMFVSMFLARNTRCNTMLHLTSDTALFVHVSRETPGVTPRHTSPPQGVANKGTLTL